MFGGRWEIRVLETYGTSSGISYDELNGSFQGNLDTVELVGIAGDEEWVFCTQNRGAAEIVLDQILEEGTWAAEEAVLEPDYRIPERDSDEEEETIPPTKEEIAQRWAILKKLGIMEKPAKTSGRNPRSPVK